jgi:hypothetical protein
MRPVVTPDDHKTKGLAAISVVDIAKDIDRDYSNVKKVVKALVDRHIILRSEDGIMLNLEASEWLVATSQRSKKMGYKKPHDGVPRTPDRGSSYPNMGYSEPQTWGIENPRHGVPHTPDESSNPPDDGAFEVPLDHERSIRDPKIIQKNACVVDFPEMEISPAVKRVQAIGRACKLMLELGYFHVGADPAVPITRELNKLVDKNPLSDVMLCHEYVDKFLLPMVKDCPAEYRSKFSEWSSQFNFCLKKGHGDGEYIDIWKSKKGPKSHAVSNFDNLVSANAGGPKIIIASAEAPESDALREARAEQARWHARKEGRLDG